MTVVVIGNATVDTSFVLGRLPEPGETLLAHDQQVEAGGKGLNQALVAHRAGAAVVLVAVIGDDSESAMIRSCLQAEGLSLAGIHTQPGPTDQSIIWLAANGENVIVSTAACARCLTGDTAAAALAGYGSGDVLLLQGNLSPDTTRACLRQGRAQGLCTVLNPAPIHFDYAGLWSWVDVAVVNQVEATTLSGSTDPTTAAAQLLKAGVGTVIITQGGAGVSWFDAHASASLPAVAVTVVDTTGAGDTFCGMLAAGLATAQPLTTLLPSAVAAAALTVSRRGTSRAFPTPAELAALRANLTVETAL